MRLFLESRPRLVKEIEAAALSQDISKGSLKRAKKDLKIRSGRAYENGGRSSYWLLPGQELPRTPSDTPALDDWLRRWRELYPRREEEDED